MSVFHFIEATAVASQRAALNTFLNSAKAYLDNGVTYTIRTAGRELTAATGALSGAWTEPTAYTGTGAGTGEQAADATQIVVRWLSNHIVGSRFLQGRTFLPGMAVVGITNGNFNAANRTSLQTAGQTLITAAVQLAIWHRPVAGAGGIQWAADTCVVNSELGVLRRRRK